MDLIYKKLEALAESYGFELVRLPGPQTVSFRKEILWTHTARDAYAAIEIDLLNYVEDLILGLQDNKKATYEQGMYGARTMYAQIKDCCTIPLQNKLIYELELKVGFI